MKTLEKVSDFVGKYMAAIVIAVAALALLAPGTVSFIKTSYVNYLLGIVMFGMGLTLKPSDFKVVFSRPKDVIVGCIAQFTLMPLLAFLLTKLFNLPAELAVGVILVGTCPGGTSSNVITFMSKGDVALSVTMTSVSTVLSPILTPFITYMIIGEKINFDPVGMFWSIVQIVILPICLGLAVKSFLPKLAEAATDYLPAVSSIAISLIIAGVIGASRDLILKAPGLILLVVILHNCCGYALGFAIARFTGLSWKKAVALSIEVGMQNSGLATGLAKAHFAALPAATVPGAVFSAWHNISGALLAWAYQNYLNPKFDPDYAKEEAVEAEAAKA